MRRPMTGAAGMFGAGILTGFYTEWVIPVWIIMLNVAAIIAVLNALSCRKQLVDKAIIIVICFFLSGGLWMEIAESDIDPVTLQEGQCLCVEGVVTEINYDGNKYNIVVDRGRYKTLVKYYCNEILAEDVAGKSVKICGKISLPRGSSNPGCFDYSQYLRSCGIQAIMTADKIELVSGKIWRHVRAANNIKNTYRSRIEKIAEDENVSLIMAIMFGDKTLLSEETYTEFQENGTAHVLAVSGLHTGIIYAFFVFVWRGKKGALFYCVTILLMLMYMTLAEFSPSVVRASCMILMHSVAGILKCRYDLLSAAGTTFLGMLIVNPFQLFHSGFQLSFIAIACLGVILPFVSRFYQGVFLPAIAIQAGMMPYTAYLFNYISLGAAAANIPVIFIAGLILPVGLCSVAALVMPAGVFSILVEMMELCCGALFAVNELFYASGKTAIDVISPPVWLLVIYYGVCFYCMSETGQLAFLRKNKKIIFRYFTGLVLVAVLSIPLVSSPFSNAGITFVDVGQGDCIHIRTNNGKNYLIDGGGSTDYDTGLKVLKPYLLKNGVKKIDAAFVTHLHEDHYGGIRSLAADGMIEKIMVYEANRLIEDQLKNETNTSIDYLYRGNRIRLDDQIYIDVLAPEQQNEKTYRKMSENEEDENKSSLIFKIQYNNISVLVTGDIDADGEAELIKKCGKLLECDIIKVPHHGSKYSSSEEFVAAVNPSLAVIQVGKNNYGHPSEDAIVRYMDAECAVARNDKDGAVGIIINGSQSFEVVKMIH